MTLEHTKTVKGDQIELRIRAGQADVLVIISAKGGWNYGKHEYTRKPKTTARRVYSKDTSDYNVRLSMNGVAMLTYDQWVGIDKLINSTLAIATLEAARVNDDRPATD